MNNNELCDINRLPLGQPEFTNIRDGKMIYVDKTGLLAKIAEQKTPFFFSRPRRFGKSLLINTLHTLFAEGLSAFQGLDIEKTWHDTTYKVVHLDFSILAKEKVYFLFKIFLNLLFKNFSKLKINSGSAL